MAGRLNCYCIAIKPNTILKVSEVFGCVKRFLSDRLKVSSACSITNAVQLGLMQEKTFSFRNLSFEDAGPPRYEQLAKFIERTIRDGSLAPGDRLPTVRQLAAGLGVSATTIGSAFELLTSQGLIRPEVGRGTFVMEPPKDGLAGSTTWRPHSIRAPLQRGAQVPWRRRALMSLGARLRASYPDAMECSTGRPDPALLPLDVIRRAWEGAIKTLGERDLQYAGPEAIEPLALRVVPLLGADLVPARAQDLIIGSSAQQFLALAHETVVGLWGLDNAVIAVEEPGYPTILDTFERAGAKLIGIAVDKFGAVPESLEATLRSGAKAALFTPRGHNPTGASWTHERMTALADVLAAHSDVIAIEDDHFSGVSNTHPGSLLSDPRLESRTLYIRSFSKSIAPDLRVAVAVARPRLRELLADAKSFADGWTSRLLQRVLAAILADEELYGLLDRAREAYRERRQRAANALNGVLASHDGGTWCGPDGVNLWVHLPPGVDAKDVVERSAAAGVRAADGEAFFLAPGHSNMVRLNAGSVPPEEAGAAGKIVAESALACGWRKPGMIHV